MTQEDNETRTPESVELHEEELWPITGYVIGYLSRDGLVDGYKDMKARIIIQGTDKAAKQLKVLILGLLAARPDYLQDGDWEPVVIHLTESGKPL